MIERYDYKNAAISGAQIDIDLNSGKYRGSVYNLPNKVYHGLSSYYSSTQLKYLYANTPIHFKEKYLLNKMPSVTSPEMQVGSLFHTMLLTPNDVANEFFMMPDMDMRTKAGKEVAAGAALEAKGKTVIRADDFKRASEMCDSAMSCKTVRNLLEGIKAEVSYFWKCPFSGLNLRSKVDGVTGDKLIELKSARSARPIDFERAAYNMNYDLSAAHYLQGLQKCNNETLSEVFFIVVENTYPYVVQCYKASDAFIDGGYAKWLAAVSKLEAAFSTGKWVGYDDGLDEMLILDAPAWAKPKLGDDDKTVEETW